MRPVQEISLEIQQAHMVDDVERMVMLADELTAYATDEAQAEEYRARAMAAAFNGETALAADYYLRSISAAEAAANLAGAATSHVNLGYLYLRTGQIVEAEIQFRRAMEIGETISDATVLALATGGVGMVLSNRGLLRDALPFHMKALSLSEEHNKAEGIAASLGNIAIVHAMLREFPEALQYFERSRMYYVECGDPTGEANILSNIGKVHFDTANYAEALRCGQEALAIMEEQGWRPAATRIRADLGNTFLAVGNINEAESIFEEALKGFREMGDRAGECSVITNMGVIATQRNDLVGAIELHKRAHDLHSEMQNDSSAAQQLIAMGMIEVEREDLVEAQQLLNRALECPDLLARTRMMALVLHGKIAAKQGHYTVAKDQWQQTLQLARESQNRSQEVDVYLLLRNLAKDEGNLDDYINYNDQYVALSEEIRGKEVSVKIAMQEAERAVFAERQIRDRQQAILYSTLPKDIADRAVRGEDISGDQYENAAVIFLDIVGFTSQSSGMSPQETTAFLDQLFKHFDSICEQHHVTKIKTIGDSYMAVAFPSDTSGSVAEADGRHSTCEERAVNAATDLLGSALSWPDGSTVQFRIGIDAGPVTAGVIGSDRLQYDVWGDTVNTASRMESNGVAGHINTTKTVVQCLEQQRQFTFESRGSIEVKGKGLMEMFLTHRS